MNYRHAYHAGNFADVFKHALLALCVDYLKQKPAPFRAIDTHAGVGRYDLAGIEAGKTLEWTSGVGRLTGSEAPPLPADMRARLAPYLDVVEGLNPDGRLALYPGSPLILRQVLRPGDTLIVNELHADDHAALSALFAHDHAVKVMNLDGWTALKALLPPRERRGLTLVDPPFEARDDFDNLALAVKAARRRFATGMALFWHPIKERAAVEAFYEKTRAAAGEKALYAELYIRAPADESRLNGCGMLIVNPPWTLERDLGALLPFLADRLAQGAGARAAIR